MDQVQTRSNSGCTPLHLAIIGQESVPLVQALIDGNADVNVQNMFGETPLHWAAQKGNCSITALLLINGANSYIADNGRSDCSLNIVGQITKLIINSFEQKEIGQSIGQPHQAH
jgi:uncharacterized protein